MKKLCSSALVLFLLVSVFNQNSVSGNQIFEEGLPRVGQKYVPGEIIVKFKPNVSEQEIAALNAVQGAYTAYTSSTAGFKILRIPNGSTVDEMVDIYQANASVEYAEANYVASAMMRPDDELYYHQWHLYNQIHGGIQMQSAWNLSTGSGVVVAILDTGVTARSRYEQDPTGPTRFYQRAPDLDETNFVTGYDFVNQDRHPDDDSNPGHGTHIAGIIAQNTYNEIGVAGIAYNASLMPVKVLNSRGVGTYANVAEGIIWATYQGANVINLGLGGTEPSKTLENAVAYAYNYGATVIAAAGNDGSGNIRYPAAYDDYVIAVGATRYDETLAYYSNYGLSLDLVAPGGDLNVDQNGDGYSDGILQQTYQKNGTSQIFWGYCFMEGTSMAAAHVSGVAALLIANGIANTPDGVREALEFTAEDKGMAGWDVEYGWGIVDAFAALQQKPSPGPGPEPGPGPGPEPGPGPGPMPLAAEFTAEPRIAPEPLTVQFTDRSGGNITSWLWDFGDGATSIGKNPVHTFQEPHSYTVSLTVAGPDGSDTETKTAYIQGFTPTIPDAGFSKEPIQMDAPMTVQFIDESSCPAHYITRENGGMLVGSMESADYGGITTWLWNFGDGETSAERNPAHTYRNPGTYTVTLNVIGPAGSDTKTEQKYVTLTMPSIPVANFIGKPRNGDGPLVVQFTDTSSGYVENRLWNFGDGTTSTEQNPAHTYMHRNIGVFTVSLTTTGMGGTDTETKTSYIQLSTPIISADIGLSRKRAFRTWDTVTAVITITQNKTSGQPIGGATIQGTWSGGYSGNVSGQTDGSGRVSFATGRISRSQTATFTINKVTIDNEDYDFAGEFRDSI
jgi:serine protease